MTQPDSEATLTQRIAAAHKKSAHAPHLNRATVLGLRSEIRQALDDGWSVLAIYKTLRGEGRVGFSYQAFRRHVNGLLLGKTKERKNSSRASAAIQKIQPSTPATGFTFNPQPRKEDLL